MNHNQVLCAVINSFSVGGHPYAEEANIKFFTNDFILEMLDAAKSADKLTVNHDYLKTALLDKTIAEVKRRNGLGLHATEIPAEG